MKAGQCRVPQQAARKGSSGGGAATHRWRSPPVCRLQAHYGGEDAYFLSTLGGGALGVADGVGGWNDSGISPAGVWPTGRGKLHWGWWACSCVH